jgi:hypothetical protein
MQAIQRYAVKCDGKKRGTFAKNRRKDHHPDL